MVIHNGFLIETVNGITEKLFFDLFQVNRDLRMERDKDGNIIVMPPTGGTAGIFNAELSANLGIWNRQTKLGYAFGSSTGFTLPNGAVRSPDAAWMTNKRWENIPATEREKFARVCPDFMVEIRSEDDRLADVQAKMEEYLVSGCRLGWLVDRVEKTVRIYRNDGSAELISGDSVILFGEDVLPGLKMEVKF